VEPSDEEGTIINEIDLLEDAEISDSETTITGEVTIIKQFNSHLKCQFCDKNLMHNASSKKAKCMNCSAMQLTKNCAVQVEAKLMVNKTLYNVYGDLLKKNLTDNELNEENISEKLLGETVEVIADDKDFITHIKMI